MRFFNCLLSLVICLSASALESPLVVQGQGDLTCVINPNTGTIQLYRTAGQRLMQTGSYYFLTDLEYLANRPHPAVEGKDIENADSWTLLRMGFKTAPNILNQMRKASPKAWEVNMASENDFWSEVPTYDGNIMGAMGLNTIFLVFPAMHALVAYEVKNGKEIRMIAARNIGPDLMIGSVFNSTPEPQRLLKDLPKEVQEAFQERVKAKEEAIAQGDVIQLKEPKPWVASLQNEKIVILEPANQKLLVYEMNRGMLNLKSCRSLEIELMVPPNVSVNSTPEAGNQYKAYVKQLSKAKISPYTEDELKALVSVSGNHRKDGGEDEIQATIDDRFNLTIDFVKARKLLLYNPDEGGGGITMYSVRDYTLENAIALHIDKINQGNLAEKMYAEAKKLAGKRSQRSKAIRLLKLALKYKPSLVEEAEDKLGKKLSDEDGWAEIVKQGRDDFEKEKQEEEARKKMLEEMKKKKK